MVSSTASDNQCLPVTLNLSLCPCVFGKQHQQQPTTKSQPCDAHMIHMIQAVVQSIVYSTNSNNNNGNTDSNNTRKRGKRTEEEATNKQLVYTTATAAVRRSLARSLGRSRCRSTSSRRSYYCSCGGPWAAAVASRRSVARRRSCT